MSDESKAGSSREEHVNMIYYKVLCGAVICLGAAIGFGLYSKNKFIESEKRARVEKIRIEQEYKSSYLAALRKADSNMDGILQIGEKKTWYSAMGIDVILGEAEPLPFEPLLTIEQLKDYTRCH